MGLTIDPELTLIKGLGGALLREKIVARSARRFIVIGASKQVTALGVKTPVRLRLLNSRGLSAPLDCCVRRPTSASSSHLMGARFDR